MTEDSNKKTEGNMLTLSDSDIVSGTRHVGRRFALEAIGVTVLGALGLAMGLRPSTANAQGCTDSDSGSNADGAGHGRRCRGGCTDSDNGSNADGAGHGRRCH